MKYHRRFYVIISFCVLAWVGVTYLILSTETYSNTVNKSGSELLQKVKELESLITNEKNKYELLLGELKRIEDRSKVSGLELEKLEEVFRQAGINVFNKNENLEAEVPDSDPVEISVPERPAVERESQKTILPVLVFSCNRVSVTRCLDGLLKYRPNRTDVEFPIVVSQDCGHADTANAIRAYGSSVTHIMQPDQSEPEVPANEKKFQGYFKISRHYGWALKQIFRQFNHSAVIIVEDDLEVAPDFFDYFLAAYPLLQKDSTLWCVSAWNDNGKSNLIDVNHPEILYRSDFFPGLGWMMTRQLWDELEPKWPKSYWDDWMRQPEQRKNRACIRPEISRTRTFGKIGVSNGMFFDKHLKYIHLNDKPISFPTMQLEYLLRDNYDRDFVGQVYNTPIVTAQDLRNNDVKYEGPVRITYHTKSVYKSATKLLGLMDDFKSGVPRTAYRGIVSFFFSGRRVYLAPNANWKGYDPTWS
nr:EOG090X06K9 [Eulimnadia texana]